MCVKRILSFYYNTSKVTAYQIEVYLSHRANFSNLYTQTF